MDKNRKVLLIIRWWMLRVLCPDPNQSDVKIALIFALQSMLGNEQQIVCDTKTLMMNKKLEDIPQLLMEINNLHDEE